MRRYDEAYAETTGNIQAFQGESVSDYHSGKAFGNRRAACRLSGYVWRIPHICPSAFPVYGTGEPRKIPAGGTGIPV